jgi:hypothetical protein
MCSFATHRPLLAPHYAMLVTTLSTICVRAIGEGSGTLPQCPHPRASDSSIPFATPIKLSNGPASGLELAHFLCPNKYVQNLNVDARVYWNLFHQLSQQNTSDIPLIHGFYLSTTCTLRSYIVTFSAAFELTLHDLPRSAFWS